ncbi:MAG: tetratricopeptide repeat protein [Anaerolineae bacterium]
MTAERMTVERITAEDYLFRGLDHWYVLGNLDAAAADFDEAIRLNPDYAIAYTQRGRIRRVTGNLEGALADLNKALLIDPRYPNAYYNRGILQCDLGNFGQAIIDWEACLALGEDYPSIRRMLDWAREQL